MRDMSVRCLNFGRLSSEWPYTHLTIQGHVSVRTKGPLREKLLAGVYVAFYGHTSVRLPAMMLRHRNNRHVPAPDSQRGMFNCFFMPPESLWASQ